MHETRKSVLRRVREPAFIEQYFRGDGIDIGTDDDPLGSYAYLFPRMGRVVAWGASDGDTVQMNGVKAGTYDFVHSSHGLANVAHPARALARWLDIVKPGGYVIVTVPDEDLYGKGVWPSRFNRRHKASFTIGKPGAPGDGTGKRLPNSVNLLDLVATLQPVISGAITGALLTAALVILSVWLDFPSARHTGVAVRLALPAVISAAVLFPRPVLLRTILNSRRSPWLLDEDLDQLMRGRGVGLVAGIAIGITLAGQIF